MNKYVSKFFGIMFQSQQTQSAVRIQQQHLPISPEEWCAYWQAKGFPWRTKPEIDAKRQEELRKCRAIVSNIEKGIYPFNGTPLSRADIEWLLETHELVDWNDDSQRERKGLDLRGADLKGADLSGLPLANLLGSLSESEWAGTSEVQQRAATVNLEGAHLSGANLEGAHLSGANLEGAELFEANLGSANLGFANLKQANMSEASLENALLRHAHLEKAVLDAAYLQEADFTDAYLEGATLERAHLEGATLERAHLEGAVLCKAFFDRTTELKDVVLGSQASGWPFLADIHWGDVGLTVVKWSQIEMLGDEYEAKQKMWEGEVKDHKTRLEDYEVAARANRQLAVVLQNQGLNEHANRFAYRAQKLQRGVLWRQRSFWKWLGSGILALLAGYGYRMWHILVAYVIIVLIFAGTYYIFDVSQDTFRFSLRKLFRRISSNGLRSDIIDERCCFCFSHNFSMLCLAFCFLANDAV